MGIEEAEIIGMVERKTMSTTVSMSVELYRQILTIAKKNNISLSHIVRVALYEFLEKEHDKGEI